MPFPLILGAIALGFAAFNIDKITKAVSDFFNSEEGKQMLRDVSQATEGYLAPYQKIIDDAYYKNTDERKVFFKQLKKRMTSENWNSFVAYAKSVSQRETKYLILYADLLEVENN